MFCSSVGVVKLSVRKILRLKLGKTKLEDEMQSIQGSS
jgi:hypothetical protein